MSHELDKIEGRVQMMYVGDRPWHGLGTRLGDNAVTYEDVVNAVPALNTTYSKRPVYGSYDYVDDEGGSRTKLIEVPNRALVVRDLDQRPIDVVGSKYEILQPGE